jgi:hypothetical protein
MSCDLTQCSLSGGRTHFRMISACSCEEVTDDETKHGKM